MLTFILNNKTLTTEVSTGMTLLDFIRYERDLKGTKVGCREGDCGACTVLLGELINGKMTFKSITSCLTPMGNVAGKHVVSIEGLNMDELSPVQTAMVEESGTQCGFCTVGFIVSFSALCFSNQEITYEDVISGIDGNICRCTGYKSIERAAMRIHNRLKHKNLETPIEWLVENRFIPAYFNDIPKRLQELNYSTHKQGTILVGGGTDLYVQKHDAMEDADIVFTTNTLQLKGIDVKNGTCRIGGATNVTELLESVVLQSMFPDLYKHLKLISSTPIRNIGTIAGNFVNASPIGDLTVFFIALNSSITLKSSSGAERTILLRNLYKGYKILDKADDEVVVSIEFPVKDFHFNFEKVSKRTYLDIASVNTAISIKLEGKTIEEIHLSAGGVGPIPLFLSKTCEFLTGQELSMATVRKASELIRGEIAPISDVRGTAEYKSLLLRQLFFAHFVEMFPEIFKEEVII